MASTLSAIGLNCTLKKCPAPSSSELLLNQLLTELGKHDVESKGIIRIAEHDIKPGVTSDEGEGDEWPGIRQKILDSDILVFGTPIWLGHPSSFAQLVLERMDAFLSETDDGGRMVSYGRVACLAVVGNEDGAHHVTSQLYQGLADVGFTIPANAVTYWVGRAMQGTDYNDLDETPKETANATAMCARNTAHLAKLLKGNQYPADPGAQDD